MSFFQWLLGKSPRVRSRVPQSSLPAMVQTLAPRRMLSAVTGTFTQLTNSPPAGVGTMMLLTDGTVIAQGDLNNWYQLKPDNQGNYLNGTWTTLSPSSLTRLYYGSNVLPNGKVFLVGGEYTGDTYSQNFANTGEMYDPVSNTWTPIADFPQSSFGDDPTVLLPNGKILAGYISGPETYLYNPATDTWTQTGTKLRNDASDEETWVLLPDGSVLSYDIFSSISTGTGHAQRYIPSSGTWVDAGTVPVPLSSSSLGFELGPATLLPNGKVLFIGATPNTALYDPATNTWTAGPTLPTGYGADDTPGAMLPNGHFIFAADKPLFGTPTKLFDYDYTNNTLTDITPTTGSLASRLSSNPAYVDRMLVLPNGHLLFNVGGTVYDFVATNGTVNAAWKPTISSIVQQGSTTTYTLTGKQLTGISEGASYGDDAEMSTNYPIVRLTDSSGNVKYARTTGWTPSVAAGNTTQTVKFTLPTGITSGIYRVAVIANGIASADTNLTITIITTLTLSGPSTITYHKQQTATQIDSGIVLTSNLTSLSYATVTIKNYAGTQDILSIAPNSAMGNITWKYQNGVMTLTSTGGTATPAQFQAALRAVTYFNSSKNPNTTPRQVEFKVYGKTMTSNALISTINVSATPASSLVATGSAAPAAVTPAADPAMFSNKKPKSQIFSGI